LSLITRWPGAGCSPGVYGGTALTAARSQFRGSLPTIASFEGRLRHLACPRVRHVDGDDFPDDLSDHADVSTGFGFGGGGPQVPLGDHASLIFAFGHRGQLVDHPRPTLPTGVGELVEPDGALEVAPAE